MFRGSLRAVAWVDDLYKLGHKNLQADLYLIDKNIFWNYRFFSWNFYDIAKYERKPDLKENYRANMAKKKELENSFCSSDLWSAVKQFWTKKSKIYIRFSHKYIGETTLGVSLSHRIMSRVKKSHKSSFKISTYWNKGAFWWNITPPP